MRAVIQRALEVLDAHPDNPFLRGKQAHREHQRVELPGAFAHVARRNKHHQVIALLQPLLDSPMLLMVAMMVLVMAVGTAMDMTPTILILTPVLMPLVKAAGIDPVYFGVLFIINNSIGLVTPPVGTVLNVVAGVGRMRMDDVTRGVFPFMVVQFIVLFLMVLFPQIVMWPARLLYG